MLFRSLSRWIDHQVEGEDNEGQVMLPTERFAGGTPVDRPDPLDERLQAEDIGIEPSRVHIKTGSSEVMDQVHGCTDQDESVVCALKELGSGMDLRGNEWEEQDGLVLFRGRVYVPLDAQLRHDIVEAHHDTPVTGHSGWWKTTKLVAWNYW